MIPSNKIIKGNESGIIIKDLSISHHQHTNAQPIQPFIYINKDTDTPDLPSNNSTYRTLNHISPHLLSSVQSTTSKSDKPLQLPPHNPPITPVPSNIAPSKSNHTIPQLSSHHIQNPISSNKPLQLSPHNPPITPVPSNIAPSKSNHTIPQLSSHNTHNPISSNTPSIRSLPDQQSGVQSIQSSSTDPSTYSISIIYHDEEKDFELNSHSSRSIDFNNNIHNTSNNNNTLSIDTISDNISSSSYNIHNILNNLENNNIQQYTSESHKIMNNINEILLFKSQNPSFMQIIKQETDIISQFESFLDVNCRANISHRITWDTSQEDFTTWINNNNPFDPIQSYLSKLFDQYSDTGFTNNNINLLNTLKEYILCNINDYDLQNNTFILQCLPIDIYNMHKPEHIFIIINAFKQSILSFSDNIHQVQSVVHHKSLVLSIVHHNDPYQ